MERLCAFSPSVDGETDGSSLDLLEVKKEIMIFPC